MTIKEAAIVSVISGTLVGKHKDMMEYIQELLGYPLCETQLAYPATAETVKALAKKDFEELEIK